MNEKERYATIETWANYFREETGSRVAASTIRSKIQGLGLIGKTGKSDRGRIYLNAFFSESDVREACGILAQGLPKADKNGFAYIDGQRYSSIEGWSEYFATKQIKISSAQLRKRLINANAGGISVLSHKGRINNNSFFSEADVNQVLSDRLSGGKIYECNEEGMVEVAGRIYQTATSLAKMFGLHDNTVRLRLAQANIKPIRGYDIHGVIRDFFSVADSQNAFGDSSEDRPRSDKDGCIFVDGVAHYTIRRWCVDNDANVDPRTLRKKLIERNMRGVSGRDTSNVLRENAFFAEEDLMFVYSHYKVGLYELNEDEYIEVEGDAYYTIAGLGKQLKSSAGTIGRAISESDIPKVNCRNSFGHIVLTYRLADVKLLLSHLLEPLPHAGEDGFIELEGKRYARPQTWKRTLGISADPRTIKRRLEENGATGIDGYFRGRLLRKAFFPEDEVRELFADLIAKKSKKR